MLCLKGIKYFKPRNLCRASICHKSELPPSKEHHQWPYEERAWGYLTSLLDPFTKKKFNENSKIIVVEGNVNAGKDDFARRLAIELGMKYAEPIDLVSLYINDYGYDYRALNPLLPERLRCCDWKMWHENPARHSVVLMQHYIFKARMVQYIRALQHLFNTGQGVVLNRSVFTERAIVEAMHNCGWLPLGYLRGDGIRFYDYRLRYNYVREQVCSHLHKPHLVIYLDVPAEKCMERIKNSNDPMEANSNALSQEFLEKIKEGFENVVLPKSRITGNVLTYKCEDRMDDDQLMDVIDDIKELDFTYDWHDTRFKDWDDKFCKLWYRRQRMQYTSDIVLDFFVFLNQGWYDIAGMGDSITQPDLILRSTLMEAHVSPVGYDTNYATDIKQQGLLKILLDFENFGSRFRRNAHSEFI